MANMTTAQVARRLGVKPETVYAYVSRGLLQRVRAPGERGSRFDPAEVEALATRTGRGGRRGAGPQIRTGLTLIRHGRLYYRGREATELADGQSFEAVAHYLWTGALPAAVSFTAPAEQVAACRAAIAALPAGVRLTDQLRIAVTVAAAGDPLRFHTEPRAVTATGASLLATMVEALPEPGVRNGDRVSLAARLWPRLTDRPAHPGGVAALNAALVLLADHDLAASTVAARVAASTRAHPYAVVAAGLAAFDGPLHGAAAEHAYRLLSDAIGTGDPVGVYAQRLRTDGRVPGFAPHVHLAYPEGDVRAAALLARVARLAPAAAVRAAVDGLIEAAARRSPVPPNIEFALAAFAHAAGMPADAAEAIFAVARTAGWIAHALEEYQEPGLRLRLAGSYHGREP